MEPWRFSLTFTLLSVIKPLVSQSWLWILHVFQKVLHGCSDSSLTLPPSLTLNTALAQQEIHFPNLFLVLQNTRGGLTPICTLTPDGVVLARTRASPISGGTFCIQTRAAPQMDAVKKKKKRATENLFHLQGKKQPARINEQHRRSRAPAGSSSIRKCF